jgi:hypothetical protein
MTNGTAEIDMKEGGECRNARLILSRASPAETTQRLNIQMVTWTETMKQLRNNGKDFRVKLNNGVIVTLADNFYAWESAKGNVAEVEVLDQGCWFTREDFEDFTDIEAIFHGSNQ